MLELRLRGADAGSLTSVRLRVKSVEIRAGASVLASVGAMQEMDLAMVTNAFVLATFQAPAGIEELEFTIALDSASVETASGNFDVDASCRVLKLGGKVSLVAQRNHAVVLLDLALPGTRGLDLLAPAGSARHRHLIWLVPIGEVFPK